VQSLESVKNVDLSNVAVGSILGAHIVYRDPGVPHYAPPCEREAVVTGVVASSLYDFYLVVKADGINIEKRITPEQVVSYVWTTEGQAVS
jgi:hypothetical protein